MKDKKTENIGFRFMMDEDIQAVAEIEKSSFSVPWQEQAFADSLQLPYAFFLIAHIEECVVGYCGIYQSFEDADITNIAIHPEFRHRGIAKQLLMQVLLECKRREIRHVYLEVRESNEAAIALYDSIGFEKIGIRKNFYEKPKEAAILMCKNIDSTG